MIKCHSAILTAVNFPIKERSGSVNCNDVFYKHMREISRILH